MVNDSHSSLGAEWHKEANRLIPRLLTFALLLILSHILEITPSSFDAGGINITVKDVIVVQGGLALVFCYFLWSLVGAIITGSYLLPVDANRRLLRSLVRSARRPYRNEKTKRMSLRTPKETKRWVWGTMLAYNSFNLPFALIIVGIVLLALVLALPDVMGLSMYLWDKSFQVSV